jgi:NitT/TauT family transport system substrate-binding protein/sulfonate transport system substrate-binding protein
MRGIGWRIAAAVSAVMVLMSAPLGAAETGTEPRDVTFFAVNNVFAVPSFVAVENGFWAKRGLNVKLKLVTSGREITQALQAGEAQLGGASFSTTTASARASGNMLKGVIPYYNDAGYIALASGRAIIGRRDRGIVAGDARSLIGKKVAYLSGSTQDVYLRAWLARNGIDFNQLQVVSVPVPDMPITVTQGLVDAAVPWEPYTAQMVRELGANAVEVSRGAAGFVTDLIGVLANESYIDSHQTLLEAFSLGLAEAAQFVRREPKRAAEVATWYLDGLKLEDAGDAIKRLTFDPRVSLCTDIGLVETGNGMVKDGLIKMARPFVAEDFRDMRVLAKIVKEHPELFDDLPPLPRTRADCKGELP